MTLYLISYKIKLPAEEVCDILHIIVAGSPSQEGMSEVLALIMETM